MTEVNLSEVRDLLGKALIRLDDLDGRHIPERVPRQDRTQALAGVQRDALYLAHLFDLMKVHTLSEYHLIRGGFTDHRPQAGVHDDCHDVRDQG